MYAEKGRGRKGEKERITKGRSLQLIMYKQLWSGSNGQILEIYRCVQKRCYMYGIILMCTDLDWIKMCSKHSWSLDCGSPWFAWLSSLYYLDRLISFWSRSKVFACTQSIGVTAPWLLSICVGCNNWVVCTSWLCGLKSLATAGTFDTIHILRVNFADGSWLKAGL